MKSEIMPTLCVPCPGKNIAVGGRDDTFDCVSAKELGFTELYRMQRRRRGRGIVFGRNGRRKVILKLTFMWRVFAK